MLAQNVNRHTQKFKIKLEHLEQHFAWDTPP